MKRAHEDDTDGELPEQPVYGKDPNHPTTDDCSDGSCMECGARDCPSGEPLHYHHDGCPWCVNAKRGQVRVDKLPGRFARDEQGKPCKWPSLESYVRVNVCSSAKGMWKQLSPMLLGPINVNSLGYRWSDDEGHTLHKVPLPQLISNVENLWQYSKVWPGDEDPKTKALGREFFSRRSLGWHKKKADRYPLKRPQDPKSKSNPPFKATSGPNKSVPLYSYWFGERLTYLEARKKIYCPIYERMVRKTDAYKELERLVLSGQNVLLIGYDGYARGSRTWKECFEDCSRPFGHEMVLACMLDNQRPFPWE